MNFSPKRILVGQTLYLGDVILSLPLIRQLKIAYPGASIDILVRRETEEAVRHHPAISSVIVYDKHERHKGFAGLFSITKYLHSCRYDLAFILPGSIRTALAIYFSGIPRRIGTNHSTGIDLLIDQVKFPDESWRIPGGAILRLAARVRNSIGRKRSFTSSLFTDVVEFDYSRHAIERNLQLLEPLGVQADKVIGYERLCPEEQDQKTIQNIFTDHNVDKEKIIAVAPGSQWNTKRWLPENFIEVIRQIVEKKITVALIGGMIDAEICNAIASSVDSKFVLNVCDKLTVFESAAFIQRCSVLLTNDSAAMHIGAAMSIPCVIIMGPTIPGFGFSPRDSIHKVMEVNSLWCRPCTPFGGVKCPAGTFECMKHITTDSVVNAVMEKYNRS